MHSCDWFHLVNFYLQTVNDLVGAVPIKILILNIEGSLNNFRYYLNNFKLNFRNCTLKIKFNSSN